MTDVWPKHPQAAKKHKPPNRRTLRILLAFPRRQPIIRLSKGRSRSQIVAEIRHNNT